MLIGFEISDWYALWPFTRDVGLDVWISRLDVAHCLLDVGQQIVFYDPTSAKNHAFEKECDPDGKCGRGHAEGRY